MILLIALLAFLLGYALGKRKPRAQKQRSATKRVGDIRSIGGFLTYDGTEQSSDQWSVVSDQWSVVSDQWSE